MIFNCVSIFLCYQRAINYTIFKKFTIDSSKKKMNNVKNEKICIDKIAENVYNNYNMLSRVDERIGFMTPQQPVKNKVLIPTK